MLNQESAYRARTPATAAKRPAPERTAALAAPAVGMAVGYSVGTEVTPPVGTIVVGGLVATVVLG